MTTYGLTSTGFLRKPASAIRADIVTAIRALPGLANARIGTGSVLGNLVDVFTNQISLAWEAAEALYMSLSRDSASGQSLDNTETPVGKSRVLATHSLSTLTLWTVGGSDVTVVAGNQVKQSSTGTLWETTADATIPAAVAPLEDLAVGDITWVSGNVIKYYLPASTDLSGVAAGDLLIVTGSGVSGNDGAFAIVTVNDGSDWVTVTNPNRSDNTGDETGSPAIATITNGHLTVAAQAISTGALEATAQSIDTINTPLSNWDGVVNLADATTGKDRETDAEFRARTALELVIATGSTMEAIKAQLRLVDGVTYASAVENRTATTDGDGNLPHSYRFTVVGGSTQDIVNCIGTYGAGAIATNGSVSGTWTDPEGNTTTIYFDRVTNTNIWLIVDLTTDANYPADGNTLVKAALIDYADTLTHGEDLINWKLTGALYAAGIPGITGVSILQGLSDPPTVSTNLAIDADKIAAFANSRISII